ncbi:mitochondrial fission ELM1 family protein [Hyphobacterium sp. HN65]|uniref:Mitochondrial fission ELM1 family protein n=1 Tax=Hyphobacterium lacteum TaxID=3116575 RepID=A0ABU7LR62_9PROT|nr:mitochondrial fission ELM1 family protein [Hyphobacterium sp. HN65]MEE2526398.1 mitochondrial fission ELM1 family protein [Hyphobacterium sp. HN65]
MSEQAVEIWAVADTRRGVENQAIGLAEALSRVLGGKVHRAVIRDDGYVTLPDADNPAIWIGCGRPAIAVARQHRKSYPDARFVYVQDPRGHYGQFDAIVAPQHDRLSKPNSLSMIGSPNRLTPERLAAEKARFDDRIAQLPGPRAAVLIGGPNKRLKMSPAVTAAIAQRCQWVLEQGHSLMVSTSRRTPLPLRQLLAGLEENERCWVYDGEGENPYFSFLAAADRIFVTEDSTNMLTEAAFTGKPVYSLPLDGNPGKFRLLHAALEAKGILRPFLGRLDDWTYVPLDETTRIATLLARQFSRIE